jgi:hypothetical protein
MASSIVPFADTVIFKSFDFSWSHFGKLSTSTFRREKVTRPLGNSDKRTLKMLMALEDAGPYILKLVFHK